jgi:hypothetical protein
MVFALTSSSDFMDFFAEVSEAQPLIGSVDVATYLTPMLVLYLGALGWRLSRPLCESSGESATLPPV